MKKKPSDGSRQPSAVSHQVVQLGLLFGTLLLEKRWKSCTRLIISAILLL